jgi:hypothetical protein
MLGAEFFTTSCLSSDYLLHFEKINVSFFVKEGGITESYAIILGTYGVTIMKFIVGCFCA